MDYDIDAIARDMMLEPEDLREILQIFILESSRIITQCEKEYAAEKADSLANLFHALKGAALNLRLLSVGNLAAQLEQETKDGKITNVGVILPQIKKLLIELEV